MTDSIRIERDGSVVVLHMDDGKANALGFDMIAGLARAISDADADDDVRAVVIHGRPGCFSGGFDLGVMRAGDMNAVANLVADGGDLVTDSYGSGLPVVAACTGHAFAAGALLLLGCDHRVGADVEAKVGLPEVAMQMSLPAWAVTIATDRLSRLHLQRALANGRLTTPAEAVDVGYIDEVVPAGQVLERAVSVARGLADDLDPAAYRGIIASLRGDVVGRMRSQAASMRPS